MGDKTETDVQETANLRNLAQRCVRNFILISRQQVIEDGIVDSHWAARQSAEFNVWCTNIGVNGEGLRSIDLRLKDVPEISDLLRHLLNSLDCDLKELLQPTEAPTQSSKQNESLDDTDSDDSFCYLSLSSSDGSEEDLGIDNTLLRRIKQRRALQKHVSDTIDRLHNHAQQIELAGARHRRERVDIYREKDGPKEVYEGFKRLASWRANENFKSASSMIKLRIAESVARRRIRFEYLKEHQRKRRVILNYQTENLPQEPQEPQVNPLGTTIAIPDAQREITQATKPQASVKHGTILSATVNTRLDMKPDMNRPERVESVASVALRHPGFPPPPKVHRGKFQCPYCFLEFPARDALKDRWSQHVMHDFEPYFCILEECDAPFNLPTTFDGLMGHLQDHHPKRYHVAISDVEERDFNEVEFEHYIKMNGEVSDQDLASLKKGSQRRGVFLFTSCPFCGGYPDVLEKTFPDPMTEKAQIELRKHIKQHMQDIALFLPPYRDDISDNDDLESGVMGGRRLGSDITLLEDQEDWKSICDRSSCDCKEVDEDETIRNFTDADAEILQNTPSPDANEDHDVDFWAQILTDSSLYDRSAVTDNYYYEDERLRQFIENSIIQEPESDAPELKVIPTAASEHLLGENLLDASKQGDRLKVDDLLRQGADPDFADEGGFTPLYYAVREGDETVARILVENGADMDIPCSLTAFWEAVYSAWKSAKHDSLAKFLLKQGLLKSYTTKDQQACLIRAICDGEVEEVNFLLRRGADPDIRDRWNVTPLFWAAFHGQTAIVDLLIDLNVDVNAANSDNRTPLFQASIRGFTDVTKLLIEKGADAQVEDCWGETALFWADILGHNDVVEALKINEKGLNLRLFRKAMRRRAERKQKELEEHLKKMQQKEIQAHLMEFIIQNTLDRFFPADNHFLEQVVKRATNLRKINPSNQLDPKDLSLLALHQFVVYCDDSGSMKQHSRIKHLASFVRRIASIATRAAPFNEGIELRFINAATTPAMSNPSLNQINEMVEQNPFNGWTEIGINLKEKVLQENIYRQLQEHNMQRPVLVHIITDGRPTGPSGSLETLDTLQSVILECGENLAKHGYEKNGMPAKNKNFLVSFLIEPAVRFHISQIGRDPGADQFLDYLRSNRMLDDALCINDERIDEKLEELLEDEVSLEKWLLKLLVAPLVTREPR